MRGLVFRGEPQREPRPIGNAAGFRPCQHEAPTLGPRQKRRAGDRGDSKFPRPSSPAPTR
jgi:hypothetical protein